jgi:hypothetical protein
VITSEIRAALENITLDLRTATELEVKELVENIGAIYVDEENAMEHVKDMLIEHADMDEESFEEHIKDEEEIENKDIDLSNIETPSVDNELETQSEEDNIDEEEIISADEPEEIENEDIDISNIETPSVDNELETQSEEDNIDEEEIISADESEEENEDIDLSNIATPPIENELSNNQINKLDNIDIDDIIDTNNEESDLSFVKDNGDVVDFKENNEWHQSGDDTKKVEGIDGDFNEYVSNSNSNISVFIEDDYESDLDI